MVSPLASAPLFHIGPVPITEAVVVTWAIMAILTGGGAVLTHHVSSDPSRTQAVCELVVGTVDRPIREMMQREPPPCRAFIRTLFASIFVANWSSLVPGVRGYLATFATLSVVMIPLNVIESITRTFSLFVRLFGNVMSGVFVIGIVLSLAGLLVPIPLMALDMLIGRCGPMSSRSLPWCSSPA